MGGSGGFGLAGLSGMPFMGGQNLWLPPSQDIKMNQASTTMSSICEQIDWWLRQTSCNFSCEKKNKEDRHTERIPMNNLQVVDNGGWSMQVVSML